MIWGLRLRLWRELREHRRLSRRRLRDAGVPRWRAWRDSYMPAAARRELVRASFDAWGVSREPGRWRKWARYPGVLPAAFLLAALCLLLPAPTGQVLRASLRGRLPYGPSNGFELLTRTNRLGNWLGDSWDDYQRLRAAAPHADLAAFYYDHVLWDGPRGQEVLTVIRSTPNLPALLGVAARPLLLSDAFWRTRYEAQAAVVGQSLGLNNRAVPIEGIVPEPDWYLFRQAQMWLPLPAPERHGVYIVAPVGVVHRQRGWAAVPLPQYFLDPLGWARHLAYGAVALWFLMGCGDCLRLVRRQGIRCLPRALGYWTYAIVTLASFALFLLALCGYLIESSAHWYVAGLVGAVLAFMLGCVYGIHACMADQRYRCRSCLRRLRMPLAGGEFDGILLAAPTVEYICPRGHGKLLVPLRPGQLHPLERWSFARDLWQELRAARTAAHDSSYS